jgi:hypothetical protein
MGFEDIAYKPMPEIDLLNAVSSALQSNFSNLQDRYFFIKLEKCEQRESKISWVKDFADINDLFNFYFDSKFQRACILVRFKHGRYRIFLYGHSECCTLDVFQERFDILRKSESLSDSYDRESFRMLPKELLGAFGDISTLLQSNNKKAV